MPETPTLRSLAQRQIILVLFVFTLASVLVWIGASIYFSLHKTNLPDNVKKNITIINPVIDRQTLQTLQDRRQYTQEELQNFPIVRELDESQKAETKKAAPTQKAATGSAVQKSPEPSPTPTATQSGLVVPVGL